MPESIIHRNADKPERDKHRRDLSLKKEITVVSHDENYQVQRKKNHKRTQRKINERIINQLAADRRTILLATDPRVRLENRMYAAVRKLERYKYTLNWPRINSSPLERAH